MHTDSQGVEIEFDTFIKYFRAPHARTCHLIQGLIKGKCLNLYDVWHNPHLTLK